jgi:hypothetical protein
MDGHDFYTHFQIFSKDDPRNLFLRRVECHVTPEEASRRQQLPAPGQSSGSPSRI